MLSKNDLQMVRGIVTEVVTGVIDAKVPKMIATAIEANNHVLKREIRDEIHSVVNGAVSASEQRMIARIDDSQCAILEAIDELVLPRIKENRRSIIRLNKAIGIA